MHRICLSLIVSLLLTVGLPTLTPAQEATPIPEFDVAGSLAPVALFDALRAAPFPDELLPENVSALRPFDWRDSNDPDLAGSIGAVIYADEDPFGPQPPATITYMVFPDANGPQAPLETVRTHGDPIELSYDGQQLPAGRADLGGMIGLFVAVDNVLVYGMALPGDDADKEAAALTEAGIAHLVELATSDAPRATPVSSAARSAENAFLAVAAAPFPADELPFDAGALVVLPMSVSRDETAGELLGALLVRDADRTYRYPLATYRFYRDEAAARGVVSTSVGDAVKVAEPELPPETEIPYPTEIIHRSNDTTSVVVQVRSTVVTAEATQGDQDERRATALTLARIAVDHLEDVTGKAS